MRPASLALLVIVSLTALACGSERTLAPDEIRTLLSGATVEGTHELDHYSFRRHYRRDGTFQQEANLAGSARSGRWWLQGNQICIRWDRQGSDLCRVMKTDDEGRFWKVMTRRSGQRVTVVTYHSFVDERGNDLRRHIKPGATMADDGGVLALVPVLFLICVVIAFVLLRGQDNPRSLRNRIRRRLGPLRAGDAACRYQDLSMLPASQLDRFALSCAAEGRHVYLWWAFEAMQSLADPPGEAWHRLWSCFKAQADAAVLEVLGVLLKHGFDDDLPLPEPSDDLRFSYLLGKACMTRAKEHQSTSDATFTYYKTAAMSFFDHIRQNAPPPQPSLATPYRGGAEQPGYAELVGPDYEALLYMKYTPPARPTKRSSSSYAGGG